MRPRVGWFVLLFCLLAWYAGPGISLCEAQTFGPWLEPAVNVGPPINTEFNDTYAILSKDGLTMYFASDRLGTHGGLDLWVAKRDSLDDPWHGLEGAETPPTNMTALNTEFEDSLPALSSDEHVMFFYSTRVEGSCGQKSPGDIWMTRRHDTRTEEWEPPVNVGCNLNTEYTEIAPAFFENPETGEVTLYYGSNRPGSEIFDVYASPVGEDGYFGPGELVKELSSPKRDTRTFFRKDGLEAFITSDRDGGLGGIDIWVSTRATLSDKWTTPVNLGKPVNSSCDVNISCDDGSPWLSKDGTALYFFSNRDGGYGKRDIYYVTRVKIGGE